MEKGSLENVLGDKKLRRAFSLFLKRRFMSETLELWDEIHFFEERNRDDKKEFCRICGEYLVEEATSLVNLPGMVVGEVREVVREVKRGGELPENVFDSVRNELWIFLGVSCLPGFWGSDQYVGLFFFLFLMLMLFCFFFFVLFCFVFFLFCFFFFFFFFVLFFFFLRNTH